MTSYFFDGKLIGVNSDGFPEGDREYNAEDHANFYRGLFANGIVLTHDGDACKVTTTGTTTHTLHVMPGRILINGYQGIADGSDEFANLNELNNGRYRVVIRLNISEDVRDISCKLVFGSATEYPTLVRVGNIYEMSLANVVIANGLAAVTDTRLDPNLCGALTSASASEIKSYTTSGSANNYTITPEPALAAYVTRRLYAVTFHAANTSNTVNINISGLGNRRVYQYGTTDPHIGQISTNSKWILEDTGSAFILVSAARPPVATQTEAEGGTDTAIREWTAQRIKQAATATNLKYQQGTYIGTGTSGTSSSPAVTLNLNFKPLVVFVKLSHSDADTTVLINPSTLGMFYATSMRMGGGPVVWAAQAVSWYATSWQTFVAGSTTGVQARDALNDTGETYVWTAIGI